MPNPFATLAGNECITVDATALSGYSTEPTQFIDVALGAPVIESYRDILAWFRIRGDAHFRTDSKFGQPAYRFLKSDGITVLNHHMTWLQNGIFSGYTIKIGLAP